MGVVDSVEAEVRELVRRGLDPVVDRLAMRMLIDEVASEYDAYSLASSPPPLADSRLAATSVYDAVAGYGPLQRHLNDFQVEVWINERLTCRISPRLLSWWAGPATGVCLLGPLVLLSSVGLICRATVVHRVALASGNGCPWPVRSAHRDRCGLGEVCDGCCRHRRG